MTAKSRPPFSVHLAVAIALVGLSAPGAEPGKPAPAAAQAPIDPVPKLVQQLASSQLATRVKALDRLGSLGPKAAAAQPALLKALKDPEVVARNLAAWALGTLGSLDTEVLAALGQALSDPAWTVGHNASLALGRMGPAAVPTLRRSIAAPLPRARMLAALALVAADPGNHPEMLPLALEGLGLPAEHDMAIACRLVGALGSVAADAVPSLTNHLASTNRLLRQQLTDALGGFGPPAARATPRLLLAARNDPESGVRLASVTALGRIREPREMVLPFLVEGLASTNERVAGTYAWALSQFRGDALPALASGLAGTNPVVRANALATCILLGPEVAPVVPDVVRRLEDPVATVRSQAAYLLGTLEAPGESALAALRRASVETNELVRSTATEALEKLRSRPPRAASPAPGLSR